LSSFCPKLSPPIYLSHKTDNYQCYRAPALISIPGSQTIMVFVEGRNGSSSVDECGNGGPPVKDIVMRRSKDGGVSWEAQRTLFDGRCIGNYECGYPSAVYDQQTSTTWLMYSSGSGTLVSFSTDEGQTWAKASNTSLETLDPNAKNPSVGHGIQLTSLCSGDKAGRLILPWVCGTHSLDPAPLASTYSCLVYSDDHGKSWVLGAIALAGTRESELIQVAECSKSKGGVLYSNQRNEESTSSEGHRAYSWSYDAGETFASNGIDPQLTEPVTSSWIGIVASVARLPPTASGSSDLIIFSDPASTAARSDLAYRYSSLTGSGNVTWSTSIMIHSGPAGYSDLGMPSVSNLVHKSMAQPELLVVYENGLTGEEYFQRVSIQTLTIAA